MLSAWIILLWFPLLYQEGRKLLIVLLWRAS
jgi:hypothetical protein